MKYDTPYLNNDKQFEHCRFVVYADGSWTVSGGQQLAAAWGARPVEPELALFLDMVVTPEVGLSPGSVSLRNVQVYVQLIREFEDLRESAPRSSEAVAEQLARYILDRYF